MQRNTPKPDAVVDTPAGRGRVTEVNLLRGQIKVLLDSQPDSPPKIFDKSELTIIRDRHCGNCRKEKEKGGAGDG